MGVRSASSRRAHFPTRAALVVVAAISVAAAAMLPRCLIRTLGGAWSKRPEQFDGLSPKAKDLVRKSFADIAGPLVDYHTHIAGLGVGGTGAYVNPRMLSWRHPFHRFKFLAFLSGAGVTNPANADQEYVDRLVALIRWIKGDGLAGHAKHHILAMDETFTESGSVDAARTEFHVPNDRVFALAKTYPDYFEPVISVHPYRPDALEQLEQGALRGARFVKWLPNSMGIDPLSERCVPFYDKMRALGLILLSHAGEEKAVDAEGAQALGNSLRLRRALDRGVRVIVAHCASRGTDVDLDDPEKKRVSSFSLFYRLMHTPKYEGLLFGEISAMTQTHRLPALGTLIRDKALHGRLVNGSDYPLPAVNATIDTRKLDALGYIRRGERESLQEIYDTNPLLFDFVLKRRLKDPVSGQQFPPGMFTENLGLK